MNKTEAKNLVKQYLTKNLTKIYFEYFYNINIYFLDNNKTYFLVAVDNGKSYFGEILRDRGVHITWQTHNSEDSFALDQIIGLQTFNLFSREK